MYYLPPVSEKIVVHLGELVLMEPMSIVWNWLISLFCVFAFRSLGKSAARAVISWRWFFLIFGCSTFFGGIGHGLYYYLGPAGKAAPWSLSIVAIFFAEQGIYRLLEPRHHRAKTILTRLSLAKIILFIVAMFFIEFSFQWTKMNSMIGMVGIVGAGGLWLSRRNGALIYLPAGVFVLSFAAVVHGFDINLHPWFNRDDLAHLIMLLGLACFYIAIDKFRSSQNPF